MTLVALVAAKKLKITKQNDTMAFITLEDMTGSMEMLVFPKVLALYSALLRGGRGCGSHRAAEHPGGRGTQAHL